MNNGTLTQATITKKDAANIQPAEGIRLRHAELLASIFVPVGKGSAGKTYGPTLALEGSMALRNTTITLMDNGLVEIILDKVRVLVPVTMFKTLVPV
jgi:hypothetical protein